MSALANIQKRYRAGAVLSNEDKTYLEDTICSSGDVFALQSAIYLYGMSFTKNDKIVERAHYFIRTHPTPGLTATCLKVVADFWEMHEVYRDELERYLDYNIYDEWYDELTVSTSFFLRNPSLQNGTTALKLLELERRARSEKDLDLLEFFHAYKEKPGQ
jgi:hypothetical protein